MFQMAFMNKIGSILKQTTHKLPFFQSSTSNVSIYHAIRCFSSSKLYIGGLSYATDENSLREAFTPYGSVIEARIIVDRESGRSRGFGFVSYTSVEEASAAIQALDGMDLHGRFIKVVYASDQKGSNRGQRLSGVAGYGAFDNRSGGYYSNGGSNYGPSTGFANHGNSGGASTGGPDNYGRQEFSNTDNSNFRNHEPDKSNCRSF